MPASDAEFGRHNFIIHDNEASRAPFYRWLRERVPAERLAFRATEPMALEQALRQGAGIGFLASYIAANDPDLVEVMPPRAEWDAPLWVVTHVDLHRTRKVQAFVTLLKESARLWPDCQS